MSNYGTGGGGGGLTPYGSPRHARSPYDSNASSPGGRSLSSSSSGATTTREQTMKQLMQSFNVHQAFVVDPMHGDLEHPYGNAYEGYANELDQDYGYDALAGYDSLSRKRRPAS
ncbi:hypothetical protein HDU76_011359, partial [Blyttiomyces sp. JEL0837]